MAREALEYLISSSPQLSKLTLIVEKNIMHLNINNTNLQYLEISIPLGVLGNRKMAELTDQILLSWPHIDTPKSVNKYLENISPI